MPSPHISGNFGDLLDRRFTKIFDNEYKQHPSMIPTLFSVKTARKGADEKYSSVGAFGDFSEFTGSITYQSQNQGYDVTATHKEFASGFQAERKLVDDDLFDVLDQRPQGLALSAARTREKHAARVFLNAFSNDSYFYSHSEGVALCSDSHTTTSGASTASGFDNLITSSLSATSLAAARIQMRGFRDDAANQIDVMPNELLIPTDLYEQAYEIVSSLGKVDTANNNANVHYGQYTIIEWTYLTDTNNWFLMDSRMRAMFLYWFDRIPVEFGMIEDFDTYIKKFRAYMRYSNMWRDWRFVLGANVS